MRTFLFNPFFDYNFLEDEVSNALLKDEGKYFLLSLDMPGVSIKDLDLNLNERNIFIKAKRSDKKDITYQETLTIPTNIDRTKIDASLENGVLKVMFPKKEESSKKIEVKEHLAIN